MYDKKVNLCTYFRDIMILDLIAKIHLFHKKHHQSFDVHAKEEAPFGVFFLAPVRKYPTGRNTHGVLFIPVYEQPTIFKRITTQKVQSKV